MSSDNYTPLGITALTLAILFFVVRYFVAALKEKDSINRELYYKVLELTQKNIDSHYKLSETIQGNTDAVKNSTDTLTKLVLEVLKSKK